MVEIKRVGSSSSLGSARSEGGGTSGGLGEK